MTTPTITPAAAPAATLLDAVLPARDNRLLRGAAVALAGSLLLALSSKVQAPFWPVPMTMQPFAVLVLGMLCGARLAAATVALYLAEGAVGLPVFAAGGGIAYLAGPTAGYLFGFLAAATLMGHLAQRGWDRKIGSTIVAMTLGVAVIYLFGVSWLAYLLGLEKAIAVGLLPFLLGDATKIVVAALLLPYLWKVIGARRR